MLVPLCAPARSAPVMLPAHVETWVQTTPRPVPDPDVALFLHGPEAGPADVNIVWRADLEWQEGEKRIRLLETEKKLAVDVVGLVPPTSMEALPLPVWQVKAWLRQSERDHLSAEFADVEGEKPPDDRRRDARGRPCLRWRGPDDNRTEVIQANEIQDKIKPGDTIVVPCSYGGVDEYPAGTRQTGARSRTWRTIAHGARSGGRCSGFTATAPCINSPWPLGRRCRNHYQQGL